jgi:DUF971 family protein
MSPRMPTPVEMGSVADITFTVKWTDGHTSTYTWANLRVACPCAACVGEWRYRPPKLRLEDIKPGIRAMSVAKVGAYALRFVWSDGHQTGIYTYDNLRNELCECEECTARRARSGTPHASDTP